MTRKKITIEPEYMEIGQIDPDKQELINIIKDNTENIKVEKKIGKV